MKTLPRVVILIESARDWWTWLPQVWRRGLGPVRFFRWHWGYMEGCVRLASADLDTSALEGHNRYDGVTGLEPFELRIGVRNAVLLQVGAKGVSVHRMDLDAARRRAEPAEREAPSLELFPVVAVRRGDQTPAAEVALADKGIGG